MRLRNGPDRFGMITRLLHWVVAALVLTALPLGAYIARAEISLANLGLFAVHKSIGITILSLMLLRVLWHRVSPPPAPLPAERPWQGSVARWVHRAFYILLVAVPLSGWMASSATGIDTVIWGRWTMPRIAPVSEAWEDAGFAVHGVLTKLLAGAVLLHLAGVVHRTRNGDGTLGRMLLGRRAADPARLHGS